MNCYLNSVLQSLFHFRSFKLNLERYVSDTNKWLDIAQNNAYPEGGIIFAIKKFFKQIVDDQESMKTFDSRDIRVELFKLFYETD